jgi:hypothetical protein
MSQPQGGSTGNNLPSKPLSYYRNGAAGFIEWAEEYVCIPIYPKGSSVPLYVPLSNIASKVPYKGHSTVEYFDMWDGQKEIIKEALRMKGGEFVHRLIIFCWMRGEGKSFIVCLIQLWKFFCFPRQMITLGANSKEQTKFVHFDIMSDIIRNSPKLLAIVGDRNLHTNEIRLRDKRDYVVSTIRTISSFSGIVSNITGYTFSEMFDMKNPKFFTQLDGSIRNIPNALGMIDSTVSAKTHQLYKLYQSYNKGDDPLTFFSYRHSKTGDVVDYWNPNMTQEQLNSYRSKFLPGEFERYFLNLWSAGTDRVFSDEVIEATNIIGVDGTLGQHNVVIGLLDRRSKLLEQADDLVSGGLSQQDVASSILTVNNIDSRFWRIDSVASMTSSSGGLKYVSAFELEDLSKVFDTDWVILTGLDRADPMKTRTSARTIFSVVAKGLIGSKSKPELFFDLEAVPFYLYVMLFLTSIEDHSSESIKEIMSSLSSEYGGIDSFTSERWGSFDLLEWCESNDIKAELVYPTYDKQKTAFSEFFIACRDGRFKTPKVPIRGSKQDNIFFEEMSVFDHHADPPKWFGSPEKMEKYGIQDDCIYSVAWGIYGGRELGLKDFRRIAYVPFFGTMYEDKTLLGRW